MINQLKEKAGFISIEAVIVSSFMIVLGLYGLQELSSVGAIVVNSALNEFYNMADRSYHLLHPAG